MKKPTKGTQPHPDKQKPGRKVVSKLKLPAYKCGGMVKGKKK